MGKERELTGDHLRQSFAVLIERGHRDVMSYSWSMYAAAVKHVEAVVKANGN